MTLETPKNPAAPMPAHQRYGIRPGQVYVPADGSTGRLVVRDVETYATQDDVVVFSERLGRETRIDAFKLANVRYCLTDTSTAHERQAVMQDLISGQATLQQQQLAADLLRMLQAEVHALAPDARRGRHVVEFGEWRTSGKGDEPWRTYLAVFVQDGADLSCKAMRALALDDAIQAQAQG